MLYNGVELPNIDSVWTDKGTYPYAVIIHASDSSSIFLCLTTKALNSALNSYGDSVYNLRTSDFTSFNCLRYEFGDSVWTSSSLLKNKYELTSIGEIYWASTDVFDGGGNIHLAATTPVDPNAPVPITGSMKIESVHYFDDSASFVCFVSGLSDTSLAFTYGYTLTSNGTEVRSHIFEESFTGIDNQYLHTSLPNLTPETEYEITFTLYADGEDTGITESTSFTTQASAETGEGESTIPDYSGQLGDIQQGIDDVQQSVDNVGTKLDGVNNTLTETKNEITSLPGKIASAIIDGIKSLFVPSEEDLTEIKDKYESMLSEKLGFIWQAFDLLTTFVGDLQTSLESGEAYEFNFPGVSVRLLTARSLFLSLKRLFRWRIN